MPVEENNISISLYPQPASSHIIVDYISSLEYKIQFLIYDMSGKIMRQGEFKQSGKKKINLNNMPSGNYYLNYCIDNRSITHKFVIQ